MQKKERSKKPSCSGKQKIKVDIISNIENYENPMDSIGKKPQKQKSIKITPKLVVSGRLDRKKQAYTAKSLILLKRLEAEIKLYCRGGDLAILNYLIQEGLGKVKTASTPIYIDVEEFEKQDSS